MDYFCCTSDPLVDHNNTKWQPWNSQSFETIPPGLISALKIVPFRDLIYECLLSKEEMKTKSE